MNEEKNVNDLMEAVTFQVARMDLPCQLSWYQGQLDAISEEISELGSELIADIEEAIDEQTGDEVECEIDFDDGEISLFGDTVIGEIGDSVQSMVDQYKAVKAGVVS